MAHRHVSHRYLQPNKGGATKQYVALISSGLVMSGQNMARDLCFIRRQSLKPFPTINPCFSELCVEIQSLIPSGQIEFFGFSLIGHLRPEGASSDYV